MSQASEAPNAHSWSALLTALRSWWRHGIVESADQKAVIAKLKDESALSPRYVFMTAMSAGIAVLGMLLSSPAVVIGAMLLSPLMAPILGAGFALAIGDSVWLRHCARSLAIGTVIAVLFCALIVLLSPLQTVTEEIASRTRPNLFDLGVAFFSALAGSYAMIRGREGTIVGVAIATALMPPLAVVGFGLATGNWTVFGGSLMLFVTNLITIALTAAIMARFYGFRSILSPKQTMLQSVGIGLTFVLLAVPLGASLRQIAWETKASRQIGSFIEDQFAANSRVSQLDIDFDVDPIGVAASVLTPAFRPDAEATSRNALERILGRRIDISINQYQVGTDPRDAEAAQIAAAKAKERAAATEQQVAAIGERLALVAGVSPDDVLIDRDRRRAVVRARPIAGTTLRGYWQLERRLAAGSAGWRIELVPPPGPLPEIAFTGDAEPTPDGLAAIELIAWAANRLDLPIALSGPEARVERAATDLGARGVTIDRSAGSGSGGGAVEARWSTVTEP